MNINNRKKEKTLRHYDDLKAGKMTKIYLSKNMIFIGEFRYFLINFISNTLAIIFLIIIFSVI